MKRPRFIVLFIATLLLAQGAGIAQAASSTAGDLGYGFLSVLTTLGWAPIKVTYAVLGLTVGGLGYVLSGGNEAVPKYVINPACKGTYVITPKILKGEEHFEPTGK